ncbi:MAG TPA: helix-turn-helix domain-containing protein [Gemmataceae bacterium]|nr:helix-turn-helix domain-containing protein [Gemmataceae bacterium]
MTGDQSTNRPPDRPAGAPWPFQEAAEFLRISVRHLIRLADQDKVRTIWLGRRRLVADSEVRRLATEGCR